MYFKEQSPTVIEYKTNDIGNNNQYILTNTTTLNVASSEYRNNLIIQPI